MIIYYPGCMATYRRKNTAEATIRILKKAGVEFKTLGGDEWCCGSVLLRTGNRKLAEKVAAHNVDAFLKNGATCVVTSCSGCYRALKKDYPNLLGKTDFEVVHITDYIKELVKAGKLKFTPGGKTRITYHDPCHLGRHIGSYDTPREVLKMVPGIELVEMPRNREQARCCGAGGGLSSAYKELAGGIADTRFAEAEGTGAVMLVTACPFCVHALSGAKDRKKSKLRVADFAEFLDERCEKT